MLVVVRSRRLSLKILPLYLEEEQLWYRQRRLEKRQKVVVIQVQWARNKLERILMRQPL